MEGFRKSVLVVSLGAAIVLGSAATGAPTTRSRRASLDDNVITRILEFFGIELHSRVSTPPG
jgi:hypothetical protein